MPTVKRSDVYNYTGWSKENVDYAEKYCGREYTCFIISVRISQRFFPNVSVRNPCAIFEKIN